MPIEILHNQTEVKQAIFETEQEIANKILFTPAPKNHGRKSVKENYPYPYYDSTYLSRISQIANLKNKALYLKSQLEQENPDSRTNARLEINNNNYKNNFNHRINDDITNNSNEMDFENVHKSNTNYNNNYRGMNNDLHLTVFINNSTYPQTLNEYENKLNHNSQKFSEEKIGYDDLIKRQLSSFDKVYEKRKDQLEDFNNEMKSNIKDIHDKKYN